jgi:uncharacterized protein YkwD
MVASIQEIAMLKNTVGRHRVALTCVLSATLALSAPLAPAVAAGYAKPSRHAKRHEQPKRHQPTKHKPGRAKSVVTTKKLVPVASPPAVLPTEAPVSGVCAGADLVPAATDLVQVSAATLCLINQQRAVAGEAPLQANAALTTAASSHSAEMVALDYFSHVSPSGQAPLDRVVAAGYGGPEAALSVAENIAAVDSPATPTAVVAMWMNSPGHRANILNAVYADSGIGVTPGTPASLDIVGGATYTQDFGQTG